MAEKCECPRKEQRPVCTSDGRVICNVCKKEVDRHSGRKR